MKSLEEEYGLKRKEVELKRVYTKSGKALEVFPNPNKEEDYGIRLEFPEYTSLCPKTSQPDFANITLIYEPEDWCIEMKAWKYLLNSMRDEGHFYEEAINLIFNDIWEALKPNRMCVVGDFNARGGTYGIVYAGDTELLNQYPKVL